MPKAKETHGEFLLRVKEKYSNTFRVEGSFLFCVICESKVSAVRLSQVKQHIDSIRHKNNAEKKVSQLLPSQSLLSDYVPPSRGPQLKEFNLDLCKMLIETIIPVYKITHPVIQLFVRIICRIYTTLQSKNYVQKSLGRKYGFLWMKQLMSNIATWPISYLVYWTMRTSAANRLS